MSGDVRGCPGICWKVTPRHDRDLREELVQRAVMLSVVVVHDHRDVRVRPPESFRVAIWRRGLGADDRVDQEIFRRDDGCRLTPDRRDPIAPDVHAVVPRSAEAIDGPDRDVVPRASRL